MFPLGSVVFPGQAVPLHVFEERYRVMLSELIVEGRDATFGTVLIGRGHEVGGGDQRLSVATRVEVLQAEEFPDGRWGVVSAGVERLDVTEWLTDDPYPRALVSPRLVVDNGAGGLSLTSLESLLVDVITLAARVAGVADPGPLDLSDEPRVVLDQMSALSPLTAFDRQHVLEAPTTSDQIERLHSALTDKRVLLDAQLGESD